MSDALADLEQLVVDLPAAVERQRLGQELAEAAGRLRQAEHQIERVRSLLRLADLLGGDDAHRAELVDEVREEAWRTGDALESATTPDGLRRATHRFESDLKMALGNLDRDLRRQWQGLVSREFQPLIEVGRMLARLGGESDLSRGLVACGTEATNYQPGSNPTEFLERVRDLVQRRDRLRAQRRTAFGEGAVASFLEALAENRAKLDMVTEEVRAWLDEHGASGRLRVSA